MTAEDSEIVVGYEIRDVYTSEQRQEVVHDENEFPDSEDEREIRFTWDWRIPHLPEEIDFDEEPVEGRGLWFDVAIGVRVGASPNDPNMYEANLVGSFLGALSGEQIPLHHFVKLHAVAILFPYLRQCISDLSERASDESFYLPVVNISALMDGMPLEPSQGWKQLQDYPELAAKMGVTGEELEPKE